MATEQEIFNQAFLQGQEAGRLETRVSRVENDQRTFQEQTTETFSKLGELINTTVTTVALLKQEIENNAAETKRTLEQRDRDVVIAADAIRNEKEATASTLANSVNKTNLKWVPRNGWIQFGALFMAALATAAAIFFGALTYAHDKTPCVTISNTACVITK